MSNFWYWLGNAASVIQILSAIPLVLTAGWFFVRARRYRRRIEEMEKALTAWPMALAIGVAGTDITGQVKQYLDGVGMAMRIHTYTKPGGVTQKNIHAMLNDLLQIKSRMTEEGVTEVHLFVACPLVFAVAVGAILDNWVPVKVYHLNRDTGTYEFWTPLYKGFIPGLETSPLKEVLGEETS